MADGAIFVSFDADITRLKDGVDDATQEIKRVEDVAEDTGKQTGERLGEGLRLSKETLRGIGAEIMGSILTAEVVSEFVQRFAQDFWDEMVQQINAEGNARAAGGAAAYAAAGQDVPSRSAYVTSFLADKGKVTALTQSNVDPVDFASAAYDAIYGGKPEALYPFRDTAWAAYETEQHDATNFWTAAWMRGNQERDTVYNIIDPLIEQARQQPQILGEIRDLLKTRLPDYGNQGGATGG